MDFYHILQNLSLAIEENNSTALRIIFNTNAQEINIRPDLGYIAELLMLKAQNCKSKTILYHLLHFFSNIKLEANIINLEEELKDAVVERNINFAELLMKRGARLQDQKFIQNSLAESIFYKFTHHRVDFRKEMLSLLLKYGFDSKFRNALGENFLHQYIKYVDKNDSDSVEIAKILLDTGVLIDEVTIEGNSVLLYSVSQKNGDLVKFLIDAGSDVNQRNNLNESALHCAAEWGDEFTVDLLIENGADIQAADLDGKTPLHSACYRNNEPIIRLLIRKGANVNVEDKGGKTPFSQLDPNRDYEPSLIAMIKEFSRLFFNSRSIHEKDEDVIRKDPNCREHFEKCVDELYEMESTKFYGTYTYYFVLKKSKNLNKLAQLTNNEEFVKNFEENFHSFSYYGDDLRRIFDEAIEVKGGYKTVVSRLYFSFNDILPDLVVKKLAKNLKVEDLPLQ